MKLTFGDLQTSANPRQSRGLPTRAASTPIPRRLEPAERMCCFILARDDLVDTGLAAHRVLECFLRGLVVVVVDLLVVLGVPMDEHAANAYEVFGLLFRDDILGNAVGHCL